VVITTTHRTWTLKARSISVTGLPILVVSLLGHFIRSSPKDNLDDRAKRSRVPFRVIPAKAGIQLFQGMIKSLDSGFQRSDEYLPNLSFYPPESFSSANP
jgi:hypothetical protein